jgi:hypothetical protein
VCVIHINDASQQFATDSTSSYLVETLCFIIPLLFAHLVGVQEVVGRRVALKGQRVIHFSTEKGMKIIS